MRDTLAATHRVHVLHHRRDRGVIGQRGDVSGHLLDRLMELPHHRVVGRSAGGRLDDRRPQPIQERPDTGDALVAEITTFLVRPEEHQVRAE